MQFSDFIFIMHNWDEIYFSFFLFNLKITNLPLGTHSEWRRKEKNKNLEKCWWPFFFFLRDEMLLEVHLPWVNMALEMCEREKKRVKKLKLHWMKNCWSKIDMLWKVFHRFRRSLVHRHLQRHCQVFAIDVLESSQSRMKFQSTDESIKCRFHHSSTLKILNSRIIICLCYVYT